MNDEKRNFPFEATVTPDVLGRGRHWITVRLKNVSTERFVDISATLYAYNSYDIDVLPSGEFHFVKELAPQDTEVLNFHVNASHTGSVYLDVSAYIDGAYVSWFSPFYEIRVTEDPAEIQMFFVNKPYWALNEMIKTETVVHAHRDVSDLRLEVSVTPPSKAVKLIDETDIDFIKKHGIKRFESKYLAIEDGLYHLTARLYHEQKLISTKRTTFYVKPS
ncbi:MAG: hypothetical protein WCE82_08585 [Halobacteriota archaeon]